IGWRGMAQRDPLNEYKSEAFELFGQLVADLRQTTTAQLNRVEVAFEPPPPMAALEASHADASAYSDDAMIEAAFTAAGATAAGPQGLEPEFRDSTPAPADTLLREPPATRGAYGKVGRNQPCPCGSGKKYKHCHGAVV